MIGEEYVEEIPLFGFDPHGEPTIRRTARGALWLVFAFLPPSWGEGDAIPGSRWDDLPEQLTRALGVPVRWEDREFFRIETPPDNAIETIRTFLHDLRRRHDTADFAIEPLAPDLTKPIRSYSPEQRFSVGERVDHPSYGVGTVQDSEPDTIRVFFPDGRTHRFTQRAGVAPDLNKPIRATPPARRSRWPSESSIRRSGSASSRPRSPAR